MLELGDFLYKKSSNTYLKSTTIDMYPLYWTTSKGGIFMRYSYEFKRKAIELFYLNTKLWDTMVLLINLKVDHQRIAK